MRYVPPLSKEEWEIFMDHLERGPSKKHQEIVKRALDPANQVKEIDDEEDE